MQKLAMKDRGAYQSEITPAGSNYDRIEIGLANKVVLEFTDIFNQEEVDFDEQQMLIKEFAYALARDKDQAVIDALDAVTYVDAPVGDDQGKLIDGNTNDGSAPTAMSVGKLKSAAAYLNKLGVPRAGRILLLDADSHEQLMNDNEFINGDFAALKSLSNGGFVDEYVGFKIVLVPDTYDSLGNKTNGLDETGTIRTCYAFHGSTVGLAYGSIVDNIKIDWENKFAMHSVLAMLRRGSKILRPQGTVQLLNDIA